MHWRTFDENVIKIGLIYIERAVAIFRKTPKRVSCNLKDAVKVRNVNKRFVSI
jgi:hypothetical protein